VLKAALAHLQFETLHPFLDGNGRLGRLLITLILVDQKILQQPLLYLSLYFKSHRQEYYRLLNQIRLTGDWERWLAFFATAVEETANAAVTTARALMQLSAADAETLHTQHRQSGTLTRMHQSLLKRPIVTAAWLQKQTGMAPATIQSGLQKLEQLGIVQELTGKQRDRVYAYKNYFAILDQGNELP
jgi:Fic family protein